MTKITKLMVLAMLALAACGGSESNTGPDGGQQGGPTSDNGGDTPADDGEGNGPTTDDGPEGGDVTDGGDNSDPTTGDGDPTDGGDAPDGGDTPVTNAAFAGAVSNTQALIDSTNMIAATDIEDVPETGSAIYEGFAAFSSSAETFEDARNDPDTVSSIEFSTNYRTGFVKGRAFDFVTEDGGEVTGEILFSGGQIDGDRFTTDVNGVLNNRGRDIRYTGTADAAFRGVNADSIKGRGSATGTVDGEEVQKIRSVFSADK